MKTFAFIPLDEIHPIFPLGLFLFGLIGMYLSYRRIAAIKSAEYMVANQFRTATETEIDHFVALSNTNGQKSAYLAELVKIRRAFGYSGVKLGHLVWIDMKINGLIQIDVDPPSFLTPSDLLSNTVVIGKNRKWHVRNVKTYSHFAKSIKTASWKRFFCIE